MVYFPLIALRTLLKTTFSLKYLLGNKDGNGIVCSLDCQDSLEEGT